MMTPAAPGDAGMDAGMDGQNWQDTVGLLQSFFTGSQADGVGSIL